MRRTIACTCLTVAGLDLPVAWFTQALRFEVLEDMPPGGGRCQVRVAAFENPCGHRRDLIEQRL